MSAVVNRATVAQGGPPFHFRYAQEADLKVSALASGSKGPRPTDSCTAASSRFLSIASSASRKPLGRHVETDITSHPDSHDDQPHFDTEVVSRSEDIDLK